LILPFINFGSHRCGFDLITRPGFSLEIDVLLESIITQIGLFGFFWFSLYKDNSELMKRVFYRI